MCETQNRLGLVWLGWVGFYGISTNVSYLMSNFVYAYILDIHMIRKYISLMTFLNEPGFLFAHS